MKKTATRAMALMALLIAMFATVANAKTTIHIGYCNDTIADSDYRSQGGEADATVHFAICLPSNKMGAYYGGKITKLRIGTQAGLTNVTMWVRTSLKGDNLASKSLDTTTEGWNEVTLDEPIDIDGGTLYVGYTAMMHTGQSIIFNGDTNSNGVFVGYDETTTGTVWQDMSSLNFGSLLIQAIAEIDTADVKESLDIESVRSDCDFAKNGDVRKLFVRITNNGALEHPCPTIRSQIGNGKVSLATDERTIAPGGSIVATVLDTIADMTDGMTQAKVWLDNSSAIGDKSCDSIDLYIYSKSYPRTILLEHFTTLRCTNCPDAKKALSVLLSGVTDVAHVAHHTGFQSDEFTLEESEALANAFGVNSAPIVMFDRTTTPISTKGPLVSFINGTPSQVAEYIRPGLDHVRLQPAFVSVDVDCSYDESSKTLQAVVSGERCAAYKELYGDEANITVYLVEDKVRATMPQKGEDNVYVHNHVIRKVLTPVEGNAATWNGDTYTTTISGQIEDNWKLNDMKVVAFVNLPFNTDMDEPKVLNCKEVSLSDLTAINTAKTSLDGNATTLYNLQGQPVGGTTQRKGVYVERTQTPNGVVSVKRITK